MTTPPRLRHVGRWLAAVLLLTIALGSILAAAACHGHVIRESYVPNHPGRDFDFKRPPCAPATIPANADGVVMRYLGVSGLYVRWRGAVVLASPFFSNYGMWRARFGSIGWDLDAIDRGMDGLSDAPIHAVVAGHSHYDHISDLPPILRDHASTSTVLVNKSGRNMLEQCEGLEGDRFVDIEDHVLQWIPVVDDEGNTLPIRIMPIESGHAPLAKWYRYAEGEVDEAWDCMDGQKLNQMKEGRPFAFLIDLLDADGGVAFRIHYVDAPSEAPLGLPPAEVVADHPVDLAMLCMPTWWLAPGYPGALVEGTRARHVLVTHYEDFFRPQEKPTRFVARLTNKRANGFMEELSLAMEGGDERRIAPSSEVCGPSGEAWTMPLPGEWMVFPVDDESRGSIDR